MTAALALRGFGSHLCWLDQHYGMLRCPGHGDREQDHEHHVEVAQAETAFHDTMSDRLQEQRALSKISRVVCLPTGTRMLKLLCAV